MVIPERNTAVEKRVKEKTRRRECLVKGCRKKMVSRGCCRAHYQAATAIIASQTTAEGRAKACETLINRGLFLPKGEQPRKLRESSKGQVFLQALRRMNA